MNPTNMALLIGDANPDLGSEVARLCGVAPVGLDNAAFADGEARIRIVGEVAGADVFVIQSTSPPTNDRLMRLALIAEAATAAGAARVTAVVPYFGYARQDIRHGRGEPLAARLAARILGVAGVRRVVTLELHSPALESAFDMPLIALAADEPLLAAVRNGRLPELTVVAPDAGAVKRAQRYASALGAPLALVVKTRPRPDVSAVVQVLGEVAGRTCLLIDDMASTGGTIAGAALALREAAAADIHALFIHQVMAEGALERLRAAAVGWILTTDSVCQPPQPGIEVVSIAPLLAQTIRKLASGPNRP